MVNKIKFKERILLALFNNSKARRSGFRTYSQLYQLLPELNQGSVRVFVEALFKEGLVEKVEGGKEVSLVINSVGRRALLGEYLDKCYSSYCANSDFEPLYKVNWNNRYRLIIVSVPEKQRKLRFQIKEILSKNNFKPWQQSIWIIPHGGEDAISEIQKRGMEGFIKEVEAVKINDLTQSDDWIEKLWGLSTLKDEYNELLKISEQLLSKITYDVLGYSDLCLWQEKFLLCVKKDPFFPENFFAIENLRNKLIKTLFILSEKRVL